jgi:hypothetical protein
MPFAVEHSIQLSAVTAPEPSPNATAPTRVFASPPGLRDDAYAAVFWTDGASGPTSLVVWAKASAPETWVPLGTRTIENDAPAVIVPAGATLFVAVSASPGDGTLRVAFRGAAEIAGTIGTPSGDAIRTRPEFGAVASSPDQSVTTTGAALTALAAGATGILVTAHPSNTAIVRIGGPDTTSSRGQPFMPGSSYLFSVANASSLTAAAELGTQKVCASAT